MKILDYLSNARGGFKRAILLKTIKLDNGEKRKKGEEISVLEMAGGEYHAEWNSWACKVTRDEFEFIK